MIATSVSKFEVTNGEGVIELKDDRWIIKVRDENNSMLFAARVTDEAMGDYDPTGPEEIGLRLDPINSFIPNTENTMVTLDSDGHGVDVQYGTTEAHFPTTALEYVNGHAQQVPSADYPVVIEGDISFLYDFVKKAEVVDPTSVLISYRNGDIYLYSVKNDDQASDTYMSEHKMIDDIGGYTINWDNANYEDSNPYDPRKEEKLDAMFAISYLKDMNQMDDECKIFLDNQSLLKIIYSPLDGMDATYILSPRLNNSGNDPQLPEDIIRDSKSLDA